MDAMAGVAPGVHALSFPDYLALDAWGSSSLKAMRRGPPARVLWERANPQGDTEATRGGSAVHCLFLTPGFYNAHFAHKPEGMRFSTTVGKAWRDDPAREGRKILSASEARLVNGAVVALHEKQLVVEAIGRATHTEVSMVWRNEASGELCKARPDFISGHYLYDVKVSRHAEGKSLAYRAFVDGWMHQLAHYRTGCIELGMDVRGGRLIVVAPKPPHYVYTLEVKPDALDLLELENLATLKAMRERRLRGLWEDTPDMWQKIEPPAAAVVEFGEQTFDPDEGGDGADAEGEV